jgi:CRP/FNR family transcriptional regulator
MPPPFDAGSGPARWSAGGGSAAGAATCAVRCAGCSARTQCLPGSVERDVLEHIDRRLVATRRKVALGHALFRAGDRFESVYAVRAGFFKTQVHTRGGRDQVTGFRMSGDLVGLDGIGRGRHHVDAIALEDSQVCVIGYETLQTLAREVPALLAGFHRLMSQEIVEDQGALAQMGVMHASQRLASFLLDLGDRMHERGYSPSSLVLRMRRSELGSYLGLELETVSRTLSKLQAAGLMRVAQREVRITDRDRLKKVRDGAA